MTTVDYIRKGLELSRKMALGLIDDMQDAPLQTPTSRGGNHPWWILGHLTYAEANLLEHVIRGNDNPLGEWSGAFGARQEVGEDASKYPSWEDVRKKNDEVRANTLAFLDTLSDADLAKPTKNCPEGREDVLGTVGACLMLMTLHPMMHYGQVADARRMAGRERLMA
ncbi:MAG: DinB family protein [Pirellulaceae bacterium]